jgi:O-succinylbenzoic acid--CoA ligase
VFPDQIEEKLQDRMNGRQFFIYGVEDDTLGEKIILVVEGTEADIDSTILDDLDKYEKPKDILFTRKFKETASGKIHRAKTIASILEA